MDYSEIANEDIYSGNVFEAENTDSVHNEEMNLAWQFVASTNVSVFLTGKAGTGKTTFLKTLREKTPKRMVVLAPTGVAAINAEGQTIHSFFQLPLGPIVPGRQQAERKTYYKMGKNKKDLIRTLDLLVIDEISMVRCDVLDAIDAELRKYRDRTKPFGGVQLLLIGDLQQLAPVAKDSEWQLLSPYYQTPYFFGSMALQQIQYVTIELRHIYRQQDETFINILGKIRNNQLDTQTLQALNTRYIKDFQPQDDEEWIRLTTHNNMAKAYNEQRLQALPAPPLQFKAEVRGNFPETIYPAEENLILKRGAQVMFLKNDPTSQHAYYNGKIGIVQGVNIGDNDDSVSIVVYCKEDDRRIAVPQLVWENTKYVVDAKTGNIKEEVEGTFAQYPLRLAWSITVHKSQGLTFEHAVLDINESFAHGQTYVALSRCRTMEGMVLSRPIEARAVITDASVNAYINKELEEAKKAATKLPGLRYQYFLSLLNEMFDFGTLKQDLNYFTRVVDEHLYTLYPDYLNTLKDARARLDAEIIAVAQKFQNQYVGLMQRSADFASDPQIRERIKAASGYFWGKICEVLDPVIAGSKIQLGNKAISKQYNNALEAFTLSYKVKRGIFSRLISTPFNVRNYLNAKAQSILDEIVVQKEDATRKRRGKDKASSDTSDTTEDKKPKKAKVDTKAETLRLYREGKTLNEISKARSLTVGTVENHLAHFVETGELSVGDVVSTEHQTYIRGIVRTLGGAYTLSDIKNQLPSGFTYAEIKLVLADINKGEK